MKKLENCLGDGVENMGEVVLKSKSALEELAFLSLLCTADERHSPCIYSSIHILQYYSKLQLGQDRMFDINMSCFIISKYLQEQLTYV